MDALSLSNVILLLSCTLKKGKEASERNSSFVAFSEIKVGKRSEILKFAKVSSERGYLVCTSASRLGVPGSNPITAPKSYEVYPSTSGLLSFNKPETVLWTIANNYYYYK